MREEATLHWRRDALALREINIETAQQNDNPIIHLNRVGIVKAEEIMPGIFIGLPGNCLVQPKKGT